MTDRPCRARLLNSEHELIAEGLCTLDEPAAQATLEVERMSGVIQKQRGHLSLELDSGRSLLVSDKPMIVLITPPGAKASAENRRRLYRLRLIDPMTGIEQDAEQPNNAQDAPRSIGFAAVGGEDAPRAITPISKTTQDAQDADAVDAVGEGQPTALGRPPADRRGETSAAR